MATEIDVLVEIIKALGMPGIFAFLLWKERSDLQKSNQDLTDVGKLVEDRRSDNKALENLFLKNMDVIAHNSLVMGSLCEKIDAMGKEY